MPIFQRLLAWDRHAMRFYRLEDRLLRRDHSDLAYGVSALSRLLTEVEVEPGAEMAPSVKVMHGSAPVSARGPRWAKGPRSSTGHHGPRQTSCRRGRVPDDRA